MSTGECCECGAQQEIVCQHCDAKEGWISVEDRLPDKRGYYLGVAKRGDGELYVGMWPWEGESFGYYVKLTHWQPLPSPPEMMKDKT